MASQRKRLAGGSSKFGGILGDTDQMGANHEDMAGSKYAMTVVINTHQKNIIKRCWRSFAESVDGTTVLIYRPADP